jgi:RHS repeat-associated protein
MLTAIRVGYAGYQWDGSVNNDRTVSGAMAGLYHVRHRVYDPELGRWTRRDPLGYVDGENLFQYVRAMAMIGTDPDGRLTWGCALDIGIAVYNLFKLFTSFSSCGLVGPIACACNIITSSCGLISASLSAINKCGGSLDALPVWLREVIPYLEAGCTIGTTLCDGIVQSLCRNLIIIPRYLCNKKSPYRSSTIASSILSPLPMDGGK